MLVFCDYYGPHNGGGAERVARQLNTRIASSADVRVISAVDEAYDDRVVRVSAVPPRDLTAVVGAQFAVAPRMNEVARRVVHEFKPHVLHAHGLHFQGSILASTIARRLRIPFALTVHTGSPNVQNSLVRTAALTYERTVGRALLGGASAVVAVSGAVRAHCVRLSAPPQRVHLIPNAVSDDFKPTDEPSRRTPTVTFVGRLIEDKGLLQLLDASAMVNREFPHRVQIVGDGPLRPALVDRAAALGLQCEFSGVSSEVPALMSDSHVVVLPSLSSREGFGLVVAEAQRSRRCVIVSDLPALRELVVDGVSGLLCRPGDVDDLARALRCVLADPELRRRLAHNAEVSSRRLSWDSSASKYLALYESLCAYRHVYRRAS